MTVSQDFLPIWDIKNDLVFLNDGSVTAVLKTSAVNFGLLSEAEQVSIIESFAGLLNSLSFAIQIVIRSERLDVSSYLTLLDKAFKDQNNPLLKNLIPKYRAYVEKLIKENEVLDKQFYVAINVSVPELGITTHSIEDKTRKAMSILTPRLDHLDRQLGRIGLKSRRLETEELIRFFYDVYNNPDSTADQANYQQPMAVPAATQPTQQISPSVQTVPTTQTISQPTISVPRPANPIPTVAPAAPRPIAPTLQPQQSAPPVLPPNYSHLTPPFVVEELSE